MRCRQSCTPFFLGVKLLSPVTTHTLSTRLPNIVNLVVLDVFALRLLYNFIIILEYLTAKGNTMQTKEELSRQTLVRTGVFDHRCLGDVCPPLSAAALRRVPFRRLPAASAKTVLMIFSVYTMPNHTAQSVVLCVIFRRLCVVHMRMCVSV